MDLKEYRKKLIGNDQERAVSPVIGVILMVAITVILAAVIAAFVLDMGSGMSDEPRASANIEGDGSDEVSVQVQSIDNADGLAIVDSDGKVRDTLTSTGASETYGTNGVDLGVASGSSEDFTVQAYSGTIDSSNVDADGTNSPIIEDVTSNNAISAEFTLSNP